MIIDKYLVLSDAQEVASSEASDYYIDALAAGDAIHDGARIKVQINTAFVTGDNATLTIALQCDDNADFSSAKTLFTTAALAVTDIDAIGDIPVDVEIPAGCERYIRLYYTVGTGTFSAGKIDARLVLGTNLTVDKQL